MQINRRKCALKKLADIPALLFGFHESSTSFDCTNAFRHPAEGGITFNKPELPVSLLLCWQNITDITVMYNHYNKYTYNKSIIDGLISSSAAECSSSLA